jgi:hypothetical protein
VAVGSGATTAVTVGVGGSGVRVKVGLGVMAASGGVDDERSRLMVQVVRLTSIAIKNIIWRVMVNISS